MIQTRKTQEAGAHATPGLPRAALVATALLALLAALLLTARPAHATTFTVNSTSDRPDRGPGDGRCSTGNTLGVEGQAFVFECTLRTAIQEANANNNDAAGVVDVVNFNIPGPGPHTISPATALPDIAEPITIDGHTEPGASVNTAAVGTNAELQIVLTGSNAPDTAIGLVVRASGSTAKGLVINGFSIGVLLDSLEESRTTLEGSFVGTDASFNQEIGVIAAGAVKTIGGQGRAERNLISGNVHGVQTIPRGPHPAGYRVEGNLIGTARDGTTALGNESVGMRIGGSDHTISGNTIAFSGSSGVLVVSGSRNSILTNSIHDNAVLGIYLGQGRTRNDPGDPDMGSNGLQNFPVLSSARTAAGTTTITARLNSTPRITFRVQFFSSPSGDEGETFVGQRNVTTNARGNASFSFSPALPVADGR